MASRLFVPEPGETLIDGWSMKKFPVKARLVAQGWGRYMGIDFDQSYIPSLDYTSLRLLMAITAHYSMIMWHFDAIAAYVNAEIPNDVYVRQPEGFTKAGKFLNFVLKLKRALYGLGESGYLWGQCFFKVLKAYGFVPIHADACVFYKLRPGKSTLYCGVYTDDLFLATDDVAEKDAVFAFLCEHYDFHNLGPLRNALGVTFTQDPDQGLYTMDQGAYIEDMLVELGMEKCRAAPVPMRGRLEKSMCPQTPEEIAALSTQAVRYRMGVGKGHHLRICRIDCAYTMSCLSRYTKNPGKPMLDALDYFCRYLRGSKYYCIRFNSPKFQADSKDDDDEKFPLQPTLYCDADFAGCLDTRRSMSGWVVLIGGAPINWFCKRQTVTALSSTEAEFVCASEGARYVICLVNMLAELRFEVGPVRLFEDNEAAISWATAARGRPRRSQHIGSRFFYLVELVRDGRIRMMSIDTTRQLADIFTKDLPPMDFTRLRSLLMFRLRPVVLQTPSAQ